MPVPILGSKVGSDNLKAKFLTIFGRPKTEVFRRFRGVPGGPNALDRDTLAARKLRGRHWWRTHEVANPQPSQSRSILNPGPSRSTQVHPRSPQHIRVHPSSVLAARQMCTPRPLSPDMSPRDENMGVWGGCSGGVLGGSGGCSGVFWGCAQRPSSAPGTKQELTSITPPSPEPQHRQTAH